MVNNMAAPESDKSQENKGNHQYGYVDIPDINLEWPKAETQLEKIKRKIWENPFVPIGLGVTTVALLLGISTMSSGNQALSQKMMRLRVGAQSFTVLALLGGVAYSAEMKRREREKRQMIAAEMDK